MDALLAFTEVLNFKKLGQLAYVMKSNAHYSLFSEFMKEVVNEYAF